MAAAELLNRCYQSHSHDAEKVAGWCRQPMFDDRFWIWVRAVESNERVGLGINTYQESIEETCVDWIQVLPAFQRKGIAKGLVGETVNRAMDRSDIIRVTGVVDGFYEK